MKEMLRSYEKTIEEIDERIKLLKTEIKGEQNIEKIHRLERRIELLGIERKELIQVASHIRSHFAPKPIHPSLIYRAASGGN
ncbi:MAG: hypothetical protein K2F81_07675 [Ruminococcus sp.]|nr:hypothetical protein [Ruminococcus sp.]